VYKIDVDPDQIRAEIMKHGPVEAEFIVYEDFLNYKSGNCQIQYFAIIDLFLIYSAYGLSSVT